MSNMDLVGKLVGRGNYEGAQLVRDWFADLDRAAEANEGSAYVFVMGSFAEILRCFDVPIVFPEINSIQTAVRHVAHEYLNDAEDYGYSPDICGYVKADVGVQLRGGEHPMGRIPKPSVAVLTNACNTYIKWGEIWERMHGTIPIVTIDVPGSRGIEPTSRKAGDRSRSRTIGKYVEDSAARAHRTTCEEITGNRRWIIDRLREVLGYANRGEPQSWKKLLELNRAHAIALQRADRRNHLPRHGQRLPRHRDRARSTSAGSGRGDAIQG